MLIYANISLCDIFYIKNVQLSIVNFYANFMLKVLGNKMDTHNLATLFGPNILRKTKGGQERDAHAIQEASEQVEESREVISVVQTMAENKDVIFQVGLIGYVICIGYEASGFLWVLGLSKSMQCN